MSESPVEFLARMIDRDEARLQPTTDRGRWWAIGTDIIHHPTGDKLAVFDYPSDAAHAAAWDPARVLAECAAKRAMLESHEPYAGVCSYCGLNGGLSFPCRMVWLMLRPYAGEPGFNPTWLED